MTFVFRDLCRQAATAAIVGTLAMMAACSKPEPPPAPKVAGAPKPIASEPADAASLAPRKSVDYMAGLKNIKDESKAVTREELERSSAQVVESAQAAKAAKSAEAARPPETKAAAAPAPVLTPPPQPAPAPVQTAEPKTSAPASNVVAKAAPTAAAPAPTASATPVTREVPDFPREAARSGVDSGMVRARLTIDAAGGVTGVQILESRPSRVFDRAVRDTLTKWKFNPGADGRSYDTEIEFKR